MALDVSLAALMILIGSFSVHCRPSQSAAALAPKFLFNQETLNQKTLFDIALEFRQTYPDEVDDALRSLFENDDGTLDAGKQASSTLSATIAECSSS